MSSRVVDPRKTHILALINRLIDCLVNIKDETGEFLLRLEDGRVIDTKGWNDWEVSLRVRSNVIIESYRGDSGPTA